MAHYGNVKITQATPLGRQRPLRITVVTETFPPEVNGVAHSISRICAGLVARGVKLQIVRPRLPADYAALHCAEAEHLRHMENGVLVPFGDTNNFTEMAAMRARAPMRLRMLRQEARRKAESLDWDRVFDDFLGELTGALSADASSWSAKQCASPVVPA